MTKHRTWPEIKRRDRRAVSRTLRGGSFGYFSRDVQALEGAAAAYVGTRYAVAVGSGTAALVVALIACGVRPGDDVMTSALGFPATPEAIALVGARPVFADVRPETGTMDPASAAQRITPRTRAILAVAAHGLYCDSDAIARLARSANARLIWDIAQAIGSMDGDKLAGSEGDASITSLNVTKPWQSLEGGVLFTNDPEVHRAARRYCCFGEDRVRLGPNETRSYWCRWLGTNARLAPDSAALALVQLSRLPAYLSRGRQNYARLEEIVSRISGLEPLQVPPGCTVTPWHPRFVLNPDSFDWEGQDTELRDRVIAALRRCGLPVDTYQTYPLPAHPAFRRSEPVAWYPGFEDEPLSPWDPDEFPAASTLLDRSLIVAAHPHHLYLQGPRVMRHYDRGFSQVFGDMRTVLSGPYTPVRPAPEIPPADIGRG